MKAESLIERAARHLVQLRRDGAAAPRPDRPAANSAAQRQRVPDAAKPDVRIPPAARRPVSPGRSSRSIDIDLARLAAAGFVTPDGPRSRLTDEFRLLKRPLIANATGSAQVHNANLIMVTSAVPSEGKTFCSLNLAMSIAIELDHSVLLVDADVAKPSLPKVLGLPPSDGLLDILEDSSIGLGEVLLNTNVEKLSLLTSGNKHPRATELLASAAMGDLLGEMASRYSDRIIIFDSPPLLAATESHVLATHMGQIVLVVKAESTLQSDVKHSLEAIQFCPIKLLVLNQSQAPMQGMYGYGYGYGGDQP